MAGAQLPGVPGGSPQPQHVIHAVVSTVNIQRHGRDMGYTSSLHDSPAAPKPLLGKKMGEGPRRRRVESGHRDGRACLSSASGAVLGGRRGTRGALTAPVARYPVSGLSAGSLREPPRRISPAAATQCGAGRAQCGVAVSQRAALEMRRGAGAQRPRAQPRSVAPPRAPVRSAAPVAGLLHCGDSTLYFRSPSFRDGIMGARGPAQVRRFSAPGNRGAGGKSVP